MRTLKTFGAGVLLLLPMAGYAQDVAAGLQAPERSFISAGKPAGPIQLDGRLDEAAWQGASVAAELTQQAPKAGQPTAYKTSVRVLVTRDNFSPARTRIRPGSPSPPCSGMEKLKVTTSFPSFSILMATGGRAISSG